MRTRGVVGLDPGTIVEVDGEFYQFVKIGCPTGYSGCDHQSPVGLRRIKKDGTYTQTMCFSAMEVLQISR